MVIRQGTCLLDKRNGEYITSGYLIKDLYEWGESVSPALSTVTAIPAVHASDADLLHSLLGHMRESRIQQSQSQYMAEGITPNNSFKLSPRTSCLYYK